LGLVKKLLIADYLGDQPGEPRLRHCPSSTRRHRGARWALYGYAFQLYYDFSGYTDIALGSALLHGNRRYRQNFNRPYAAVNIADFWRRWHISLSNWLRDYLFFSLPGQRSRWRPYLNLFITFYNRRPVARRQLDVHRMGARCMARDSPSCAVCRLCVASANPSLEWFCAPSASF
jgi:D-alanyl-lipoteichoic acid acyltransferase DltB (MBOAT superfamily)